MSPIAAPSTVGPAEVPAPRRTRPLGQWWLNRSVPVKGLIALSIPLLTSIGITASAFALQLESRSERQIAIAASAIVTPAGAVLQQATDLETMVRGFAATGDRTFLDDGNGDPQDRGAYENKFTIVDKNLALLDAAARTPSEQAQVAEVREGVLAYRTDLLTVMTAVAARESGTALTLPLAKGKAAMDSLRDRIAELTEVPAETVLLKRAEVTRLQDEVVRLQLIGLIVGLLTGVAGIALFSFGISRRVTEAAENARRLGAGEPLLPMRQAVDEIGRLKASIADADLLLHRRLDELAAARDQALTATLTKNSFLSRTSHELRTPLNAILGFAQLLEMSELDPEDRESAEHIHQAGRHLLSLINELIDISRVESGDLQVSLEPISLARVSHEVVALVRPLAAAREIAVDNRVTDETLTVCADYQRLKQVLVNLVSNAIKYNRHAGSIIIDDRRGADGTVELRVADTGQGLSEIDLERIWMPFERLDADRGPVEGTGLGLPLARALTEAMQGTLTVQSTPGEGSTFSVRLPAAAELAVHEESATVKPAGPMTVGPLGRRLTVLSIEDNMANSQVLDRLFRTWSDVSLIATDNAEEGLLLAAARRPDLILLDLHLPGMSGEEAFSRLRADPATAGTPIVVLSADATPGTVRRLLARGATAYLTKPLDLTSLHRVLEDVTSPDRGLSGDPVPVGRSGTA